MEDDPSLFDLMEVCDGICRDSEEVTSLMAGNFNDSGIESETESADLDPGSDIDCADGLGDVYKDDSETFGGISSVESCLTCSRA